MFKKKKDSDEEVGWSNFQKFVFAVILIAIMFFTTLTIVNRVEKHDIEMMEQYNELVIEKN